MAHLEQAKQLGWNTWCCIWPFIPPPLTAPVAVCEFPLPPEVVLMTISLGCIVWPHALHAPDMPNILRREKEKTEKELVTGCSCDLFL